MTPFRRGFAAELLKVASTAFTTAPQPPRPAVGVVRPASTATGNEPAVPRPTNYQPPSGDMLGAIPKQRMESPAKMSPNTWRPSPGYRPSPASDPAPVKPAPTPARRSAPAAASGEPAFETGPQYMGRVLSERQHNQNFGKAPAPAPVNHRAGTMAQQQKQQQQQARDAAGEKADQRWRGRQI